MRVSAAVEGSSFLFLQVAWFVVMVTHNDVFGVGLLV
jgi:hypothetical protein